MGTQIFDQYTLLHIACGIIAYFWGMPLLVWFGVHTLFEIIENSERGMYLINHYVRFWPGGKPYADAIMNNVGDTIGAIVGWGVARALDVVGSKHGWYVQHMR